MAGLDAALAPAMLLAGPEVGAGGVVEVVAAGGAVALDAAAVLAPTGETGSARATAGVS